MYDKSLTEQFRLRLSNDDLKYLIDLSHKRQCTVSEVIRSLIKYYKHRDAEVLKSDQQAYINDQL